MSERGGVGSYEARIGAWDEAGSLTRAEMRRRLSPSSSANRYSTQRIAWFGTARVTPSRRVAAASADAALKLTWNAKQTARVADGSRWQLSLGLCKRPQPATGASYGGCMLLFSSTILR